MAFSQIPTSVTILNSGLIGYFGISLTDFSLSTVSSIASGSAIEIAGAYFVADSDITINASSWTAITTGTTAYLALTPSGTAGSQILSASWTSTSPTWSTSKQGWYASAGSNIRIVAQAYKNSSTSYLAKQYLYRENIEFKTEMIVTMTSAISDYDITLPFSVSKLNDAGGFFVFDANGITRWPLNMPYNDSFYITYENVGSGVLRINKTLSTDSGVGYLILRYDV